MFLDYIAEMGIVGPFVVAEFLADRPKHAHNREPFIAPPFGIAMRAKCSQEIRELEAQRIEAALLIGAFFGVSHRGAQDSTP